MSIDLAYKTLYTVALCVLAAMVLLCLWRAIRGPRIADRIVAINMIGTMTIVMICVLGLMLGEGYLADVGIVYAAISFLAVVVLCKVYMGVALAKKDEEENKDA